MSDAAYIEAFNRAVDQANRLGMDVGVLRNGRAYDVFLLPAARNRSGHELRCEVVRPGTPKMRTGLGGLGALGGSSTTPTISKRCESGRRAYIVTTPIGDSHRYYSEDAATEAKDAWLRHVRAARADLVSREKSILSRVFGASEKCGDDETTAPETPVAHDEALGRVGLRGLGRMTPPRGPRRGGPGGGWLPERPKGPPPIDWARVAAAVHKRHRDFDYLAPADVRSVAGYADWENAAIDYAWSAGGPKNPPHAPHATYPGWHPELPEPIADDDTARLVHYIQHVRGGVREELVQYFGEPE